MVLGLSPRVRGNQRTGLCPGRVYRGTSSLRLSKNRVYPRVMIQLGLSPRVRGSPGVYPRVGSIPACAGEPPPLRRRGPSGRVYPRVCGGTTPCLQVIPECAGEPREVNGHAGNRVYPRVCGGTT